MFDGLCRLYERIVPDGSDEDPVYFKLCSQIAKSLLIIKLEFEFRYMYV
jgi:hypothetical protein